MGESQAGQQVGSHTAALCITIICQPDSVGDAANLSVIYERAHGTHTMIGTARAMLRPFKFTYVQNVDQDQIDAHHRVHISSEGRQGSLEPHVSQSRKSWESTSAAKRWWHNSCSSSKVHLRLQNLENFSSPPDYCEFQP